MRRASRPPHLQVVEVGVFIFSAVKFLFLIYVNDIHNAMRLSVCLLRTSGLSQEQRGLGRLKLAQR